MEEVGVAGKGAALQGIRMIGPGPLENDHSGLEGHLSSVSPFE